MDTISGLNAIKSIFATLGAKTSDSSYAVPLVDKTSAEPKGFMEMANLASVLGVMKKVNACNIDTELGENQYYIGAASSLTGTKPELFSGGNRTKCIVICYSKESDQYASGYQEIYGYNRQEGGAVSRRYYRTYNGSTQTWNDWQRMYDAGMLNDGSDLSSLASALEVAQLKTQNDYTNIDSVHGNVNVNVAFTSPETQSAWGSPSRYGVLLCRKTGGKYEVQLYFAHGGAGYGAPKMLYRTWSGESWGSWYSVAFQS